MLNRIKNLFNKKEECKVQESVYDKIDSLFDSMNSEVIVLELGEDLIEFRDSAVKIIGELRAQIKDECGFIMPSVTVRQNYAIQENEFVIYIQDKMIENRFVIPTEEDFASEVFDALKTAIYNNIECVFTNEITEKYIEKVQKNNNLLVCNLINILSVIEIKTILSDIIFKGKSINNINYIFEKIGEYVLSEGNYKNTDRKYNPHVISQAISKYLYK